MDLSSASFKKSSQISIHSINENDQALKNPNSQKCINLIKTSKFFIHSIKTTECINNQNASKYCLHSMLVKCRERRIWCRDQDLFKCGYCYILDICDQSFLLLIKETDLFYDTIEYPLGNSFARMIGLTLDELETIHLKHNHDKGQIKNRNEKRMIFQGVLDSN